MLKLKNDRQVSIILRDKDRCCTRTFYLALALAVGFHGLFLLIFHVAPITLRWNSTIFPPVQVEADFALNDWAVLADIESPPPLSSGLPPFESSVPALSAHPTYVSAGHGEEIIENANVENPFFEIEKTIYQPSYNPLERSRLTPVTLYVSGPLGSQEIISGNLEMLRELPIHLKASLRTQDKRLTYSVLVQAQSGKIFWYEPKELTSITAVDKFAENLLKNILFSPETQGFVIAGEIEMHFNSGVYD